MLYHFRHWHYQCDSGINVHCIYILSIFKIWLVEAKYDLTFHGDLVCDIAVELPAGDLISCELIQVLKAK